MRTKRPKRRFVSSSIRQERPEARSMDLWAYLNKAKLDFSRPGKPTDNAFIESFNGKFKARWLNKNWFLSLTEARDKIDKRHDYNQQRPYSSLDNLAPMEFA